MPRPKAILCVSAHWLTEGTAVTAMTHHRTIHDFGRSLPAPLFDCQYPAPGDPVLADRVREILAPTPVVMDQSWGLDHATWSVLSKAYPDADIPVVQLSMDVRVTHNLGVMDPDENAKPFDWAARFRDYTYKAIADDAPERLIDYQSQGRDAELAVADPDHFWPLLYVLGARDQGDRVAFESDFIQYGSLSMMNVVFDGRET